MKKIILSFIALFYVTFLQAQTISDVLRYSVFDVGGTARTVGIGGGIGALGADFAVLSTNPAGLATFRRSEFTFTPTLLLNASDAELEGGGTGSQSDNKTSFNFNNIGWVKASPRTGKVKTVNFGLGINRVASFHQNITYNGSTAGTITDRWIEQTFDPSTNDFTLNPIDLNQFEAGAALNAGALFDITADGDNEFIYSTDFIEQNIPLDFPVEKSQTIRRKGGITELDVALAVNINERIMIGGTIGIPILNFEEVKTYRESDDANEIPFFNGLRFRENLEHSGVGMNLKLGVILRASQALRFGLAVHTPTAFAITETYFTEIAYDLDPDSGISSLPPVEVDPLNFEYQIRTPWRFIGSAGLILGKRGFVSGDIEYVPYKVSKFNFNENPSPADLAYERELNQQIDDNFKSVVNFRVGGEFRYNILRFRGGVNLSGTPDADNDELNSALSLGFGLRWQKFFLDWAYKRVMNNESFTPYLTNGVDSPNVSIEDDRNKLMMTVGVKF